MTNLPPISPLISSQFPSLYQEEGPAFIAFVKAYYEWMEQEGEVISESRNLLQYRDVDRTLDKFLVSFRRKYLDGLPTVTELADERFLLKHIREIYSSKGSPRGLELLFRVLFNKKAELYLPGDDILRLNDGEWMIPQYLEVAYSPDNYLLVGEYVTGRDSGSTAFVENMKTFYKNGRRVDLLELGQVEGKFEDGEQVLSSALTAEKSPIVFGSLSDIENFSIVFGFKVGDILEVVGESGFSGRAVVTAVSPRDGTLLFRIINGGTGYSLEFTELRLEQTSGSTGTGAAVRVKSISNPVTKTVTLNRVFTQLAPGLFVESLDEFYASYSSPDNGEYSVTVDSTSGIPFLGQVALQLSNTEIATAKIVYKREGSEYIADAIARSGVISLEAPTGSGPYEYVCNGTDTEFTTEVSVGDYLYIGSSTDAVEVVAVSSDTEMTIEFSTNALAVGETEIFRKVLNPFGGVVSVPQNSNVMTGVGTSFTTTFSAGETIVARGVVPFRFVIGSVVDDEELLLATSSPTEITSANYSKVEPKSFLVLGSISNSSINASTLPGLTVKYEDQTSVITTVAPSITNDDFLPFELLRHKQFGVGADDVASPWLTSVIAGWESFYANGSVSAYGPSDEYSSRVRVSAAGFTDIFADVVRVNKSLDLSDYQNENPLDPSTVANTSVALIALENFTYANGTPWSTTQQLDAIRVTASVVKVDGSNAAVPGTKLTIIDDSTASDDPMAVLLDTRAVEFGTISELEVLSQGSGYTGAVQVTAIDQVSFGDQEIVFLPSYDLITNEPGSLIPTISGTNATIQARAGSGQGAIDSITVLDSGYLYRTGEPLQLVSSKGVVTASAVAHTNGVGAGRFRDTRGFLSADKYIQDNFYYQEFSYEIRAGLAMERYADIVRKIWHPAGTLLFGAGLFYDYQNLPIAETIETTYVIGLSYTGSNKFQIGDKVRDLTTSALGTVVEAADTTVRVTSAGVSFVGATSLTNADTEQTIAQINSVTAEEIQYQIVKEPIP